MKNRFMLYGSAAAVAATVLFITLSSFKPQDVSPQYVTLNAFDDVSSFEPKIVVVYENNSTEEVKLERPSTARAIQGNAIKIHETINMLSHKGYKLISAMRMPHACNYVFEKRGQ